MLGGLLTGYKGGGQSRQASASASFDYSGLENHLKSQDMVDDLRAKKYAALYSGDVAGSVAVGDKIRSLLGVINANAPGATEQNPHTVSDPLSKIQSYHVANAADADDPDFESTPHSGEEQGAIPMPSKPTWQDKLREQNRAAERAKNQRNFGWGT